MGELKRFMRWVRRVRDKYFDSEEDMMDFIRAAEYIIDKADARIPDEIDGKFMTKARELIRKLKDGVKTLPLG